MKILVTGGAGFIGSHVSSKLIDLGHEVVVVDNLSTGKKSNIKKLLSNPKFQFYEKDILDLSPKDNLFSSVTAICHQAAIGSVPKSLKYPKNYHKVNTNGFFHILDIARLLHINRFVYASSSSIYGDNKDLPKIESKTGNPLSPYAVTKQINELYAKTYFQCYGIETIGLRYFNVFGPNQNPLGDYAAVIPKFIHLMNQLQSPVINGNGDYSRDFTYIDNVVQANINALTTTNSLCFGENFNIGSGSTTTILELFNLIKQYLNSQIKVNFGPIRKGDVPYSFADINKAKTYLNYNPTVNVAEGIKKLLKSIK